MALHGAPRAVLITVLVLVCSSLTFADTTPTTTTPGDASFIVTEPAAPVTNEETIPFEDRTQEPGQTTEPAIATEPAESTEALATSPATGQNEATSADATTPVTTTPSPATEETSTAAATTAADGGEITTAGAQVTTEGASTPDATDATTTGPETSPEVTSSPEEVTTEEITTEEAPTTADDGAPSPSTSAAAAQTTTPTGAPTTTPTTAAATTTVDEVTTELPTTTGTADTTFTTPQQTTSDLDTTVEDVTEVTDEPDATTAIDGTTTTLASEEGTLPPSTVEVTFDYSSTEPPTDKPPAPKPNFIFLIADDLGWAGLGFRNPDVKTPNIDKLAGEGAILNRHYVFKFCSPTRTSFFSGRLPVHLNQENWQADNIGGGIPPGLTILPEKLKSVGYKTHLVGKWHGGMSSPKYLPVNRGFDSFLGILGGSANYFDQARTLTCGEAIDFWRDHGPAYGEDSQYGTQAYGSEAVRILEEHDPADPFLLVMTFQAIHAPLEVPQRYLDLYPKSWEANRRIGFAMTSSLDEQIGRVVNTLKEKKLWDNTLIVFFSDNGGLSLHTNNYPLKGSKGSEFEGGVRVVSFASGGALHSSFRGGTMNQYIHGADWYATACEAAGVPLRDEKAARNGLPPVDSLSMWPLISGKNLTSPRVEIPLVVREDQGSLIIGQYKLVTGDAIKGPLWPGPRMPNATSQRIGTEFQKCSPACVYNIIEDELERNNLYRSRPDIAARLMARYAELQQEVYQVGPLPRQRRCDLALKAIDSYGGFWGPFLEVDFEAAAARAAGRTTGGFLKDKCQGVPLSKKECNAKCDFEGTKLGTFDNSGVDGCPSCSCKCRKKKSGRACREFCAATGRSGNGASVFDAQGCAVCKCSACPQATEASCKAECAASGQDFAAVLKTWGECDKCLCKPSCGPAPTQAQCDAQCGGLEASVVQGDATSCPSCKCNCPKITKSDCELACETNGWDFRGDFVTSPAGCQVCQCACAEPLSRTQCRSLCESRDMLMKSLSVDSAGCTACVCECPPKPSEERCKKICERRGRPFAGYRTTKRDCEECLCQN